MGITFKEDIADIRTSKVVDLVKVQMDYSLNIHDIEPNALANELDYECSISLIEESVGQYDAMAIVKGLPEYKETSENELNALCKNGLLLFDIKRIRTDKLGTHYWKI